MKRFQTVVKNSQLNKDEKKQLNQMHTTLTELIQPLKENSPEPTAIAQAATEAKTQLDTLKKTIQESGFNRC